MFVRCITRYRFPTNRKRELLPMRVGRPFRTRPGIQSQMTDLPKTGHPTQFCGTKIEDTIKTENVCLVAKDDDFAFTIQSGARDIPKVGIELGGTQLCDVLIDSLAMLLIGRLERKSKRRK